MNLVIILFKLLMQIMISTAFMNKKWVVLDTIPYFVVVTCDFSNQSYQIMSGWCTTIFFILTNISANGIVMERFEYNEDDERK